MMRTVLALLVGCAALVAARTPATAATTDEIKQLIVEIAGDTDVPASLALAIAKAGSGFRPDHLGPNGARGVMQILPENAESLGVAPSSLWRAERNIELGLDILGNLLRRTEGDWQAAVGAYNAGLFAAGDVALERRIAETLKWERRFAEHLAARPDAPTRPGSAGHDDWADTGADTQDTFADPSPDESGWQDDPRGMLAERHDPLFDLPPEARGRDPVKVIVIERTEERTVLTRRRPPPPAWRDRGEVRWARPRNRQVLRFGADGRIRFRPNRPPGNRPGNRRPRW